jgi:uncharacterized lipoprotein YbaY
MFSSLIRPLLVASSMLLMSACASTPYVPQQLQGTIALPAKTILPPESTMLHLRLLNVSGSGGAASLLGELFINAPKKFPYTFSLQYDQSAIQPGAHYELDTQIYSGHALRMQDSKPLPLTDNQLPRQVSVLPSAIQ